MPAGARRRSPPLEGERKRSSHDGAKDEKKKPESRRMTARQRPVNNSSVADVPVSVLPFSRDRSMAALAALPSSYKSASPALDVTGSSSRLEVSGRKAPMHRADQQSQRRNKIGLIGSPRRPAVQPGNNCGLQTKTAYPAPSKSRASLPIPNNERKSEKKERRSAQTKSSSSRSSKVCFAPNDLRWDSGVPNRTETKDRSCMEKRCRIFDLSFTDSVDSGDAQSLTLADLAGSSVKSSTAAATDETSRRSTTNKNDKTSRTTKKNNKTSPPLPKSLLVSHTASRRRKDGVSDKEPSTSKHSPPLFETTDTAKLPVRSSLRAKIASERVNIPERISEEQSEDCHTSTNKAIAQKSNTTSLSNSDQNHASDQSLHCSDICASCVGMIQKDAACSSIGCSLDFCWRCERKYFVPCPNGECRCYACVESHRLRKFLDSIDDEKNNVFDEGADDILAISLSLADVATSSFRSRANKDIQSKPICSASGKPNTSSSEGTESSGSEKDPATPVWTKMKARHAAAMPSAPIQVGRIQQDSVNPIPDIPRRNSQRASMA